MVLNYKRVNIKAFNRDVELPRAPVSGELRGWRKPRCSQGFQEAGEAASSRLRWQQMGHRQAAHAYKASLF